MNRLCLIVLAGCAALLVSASPAAAEDLPQTSRFFEAYDKDADGFVTEQEFDGSGEVFRLLDKDGDGRISTQELGLPADYRPDPNAGKRREMKGRRGRDPRGGGEDRLERLRRLVERLDVDKDGVVTKAEWRGNANLFTRLDRNKDGKLDRADFPALFEGMDGEMDAEMGGPGAAEGGKPGTDVTPGGPQPNKTPRRKPADKPDAEPGAKRELSAQQVRKRFQELDQDADQQLTEADGVNAKLIERMDADQSGGVSLAEFEAAVAKAQEPKQPKDRERRVSPDRIRKMLTRFDQDRDGKVSRDEFPGGDERFDRMDVNGDGFLSDADFAEPEAPKKDGTSSTPGAGK